MARDAKKRKLKTTYSDEGIWNEAKTFGTPKTRSAGKKPTTQIVKGCIKRLEQNSKYCKYLLGPRGLTKKTIKMFKIGCDNQRITIPVFAEDGKTLLNIRRYLPESRKPEKMLPFGRGLSVSLFPLNFVDWKKPIILCEGEWDCILLYQNGFNALTIAGGLQNWKSQWYQLFSNTSVTIIYDVNDTDDIGQKVAVERARQLYGIAKTVKVVKLPIEQIGGDITDYFTTENYEAKDLRQLIKKTPRYEVAKVHLSIVRADTIESTTMEWLYNDYIPAKGLTLVVGRQGAGKSFVTIDIAAKLSRGKAIMNGDVYCTTKASSTVYFNSENPVQSSLVPRFAAAGADMTKIFISEKWHEGPKGKEWLDVGRHLPLIEQLLQQNPDIKFLIFDALNSFIGRANPISDPAMRQVLDPINDLADKYTIAIVGLMHFNKRDQETHFLDKTGGSIAYVAAARACFYVGNNPKADENLKPRRRVIVPAKISDVDTDSVDAYEFTIQSNRDGVGYLMFEENPVDVKPEQMISGKVFGYIRCAESIKGLLKDGPVLTTVMEDRLVESGTYSKALFKKARNSLAGEVEAYKSKSFDEKGQWYMRLIGDKRQPSLLGENL